MEQITIKRELVSLRGPYIVQTLMVIFSFEILVFFEHTGYKSYLQRIFSLNCLPEVFFYGTITAAVLVILVWGLFKALRTDIFVDNGTNKSLYSNFTYLQMLCLFLFVGFAEEMLFRAAIQPHVGIITTSALFALMHIRYLKNIVLTIIIFLCSIVFGYLFARTQSLWGPIWGHFLFDYVLMCMGKRGKFY